MNDDYSPDYTLWAARLIVGSAILFGWVWLLVWLSRRYGI